ncbi:MAG: ATP-binding protein [Pseudomonadota bacterium]
MANSGRSIALIDDLRSRPAEAAWFEFKVNNTNPETIAKLVSALANAARLNDRDAAYIVWGVEDDTHKVVGTNFEPASFRKGDQPIEFWLSQQLDPCPNLKFETVEHPEGRVVFLEIPAATVAPVAVGRIAYVRVGSATPPLGDHREIEAALWSKLRPFVWEAGPAANFVEADEVLEVLDYAAYFTLTEQRLPDNRIGILERLEAERLIRRDVGGRWDIMNLGALLFARRLDFFPTLQRKAVRVIEYVGNDRTQTRRRHEEVRGYAIGFEPLIEFIGGLLPQSELIEAAFRRQHLLYPPIAIRELVANALIHQDFTIKGTGPMVEVFQDRIEITNPGEPLRDPNRFLDLPPLSRNEALAAVMRRMGVCEEQGSGVDKAVQAVELWQLPPPDFRADGNAVRVALLGPKHFSEMTAPERLRACYQHAVLRYVAGGKMTNTSLRQRFGLEKESAATASRIIRDAQKDKLIKVADPDAPKSGYIPIWA